MIPVPVGAKLWLATGRSEMRKGFAPLSPLVQEVLKRDPPGGRVFCFRRRRGDLFRILWHDGQAANLYVRRLKRGRFLCPSPANGAAVNARRRRLFRQARQAAVEARRLRFVFNLQIAINRFVEEHNHTPDPLPGERTPTRSSPPSNARTKC